MHNILEFDSVAKPFAARAIAYLGSIHNLADRKIPHAANQRVAYRKT